MLMVGLTSSIIIASQALSPPGPQRYVLDAAESTFIIADELESAVHVLDADDGLIEFALADRDQDQLAEIVRYEWNPNDSRGLLRTAIGGTPAAIVPETYLFGITPELRSVTQELGGNVSEGSTETFVSLTTTADWQTWSLDTMEEVGHSFELTHPDGTTLWSVKSVRLGMRRDSSYYNSDDRASVQVRLASGDGLPTSEVLAETLVNASDLGTSWAWVDISLDGADRLLPTQRVCLVIEPVRDNSVIDLLYAGSGVASGQSLVTKSSYTGEWRLYSGRSLLNSVSGTRHTLDDTGHQVVRDYYSACVIELQTNADDSSRVRRGVRLMNSPERLDQFWQLDFDELPSGDTDDNFDTVADWELLDESGGTPGVAANVIYLSDGQGLVTSPEHGFDGLITVDVSCRATTVNTDGGAMMTIPVDSNASQSSQLRLVTALQSNGLQTATVTNVGDTTETDLAIVKGLPAGFVDFHIVIDAPNDQVAVWINGMAQGRSTISRQMSSNSGQAQISADSASAEFDYVSVRVGKGTP